jgi:two-component system, OmpR family, phosphate regulon response regulator OmpR
MRGPNRTRRNERSISWRSGLDPGLRRDDRGLILYYFTMAKILVVDDDTRLRTLLGRFLEENNFVVSLAKDTSEARELLTQNDFDLLIVDVMMPNENGIEFTADFRKSKNIPIIMLTARGGSSDRIAGLEVGADDYLSKPFEPKELLLRINNVLRHRVVAAKDSENICKFGDFIFNFGDLRLKKDEEFIHITESEAKILAILCQYKGNVVLREKLSEMCGNIDERSIDVQITRLRRKIESNPKQPHYLHTVRNRGYVLYS